MLYKLIQLLSDGQFHSGEEVGQYLGVSRTAVWKQLQKLSGYGLELQSLKGKGYCLSAPIELLNAEHMRSLLREQAASELTAIDVLIETDSTSDHAMEQVRNRDSAHGYLCFAEYQRKGRGRRGRQWLSPFGCNLYFSLVWEFDSGATALEGLNLAMGLAVVRGLSALGVEHLQLKWPNDILLDGKKLGGILLEMTGDAAGHCQVIIGIGINMAMSADQPAIDQPWTNLPAAVSVSRNTVAAAIVNEMLAILATYDDHGFAAYCEEWQQWDAFRGQRVQLSTGNCMIEGVAIGVADNGAVIIEVEQGGPGDNKRQQKRFYGGELSLRMISP